MLNEAKLPMYVWAEAVNTACYTQNRNLINKDHNKTSCEIMANKKPTVKYFHVFGAKCFKLKDDEKLGKFESKAHEGIFLGYSLESKAYRAYVIDHKKVITSMNVTFNDNKLPSIQDEDNTETLKLDNLILEDSDTEEPEDVKDCQEIDTNNDVNEPSSEMMEEAQKTLALKWVHLLIKTAAQGEQMKDLQTEHNKETTM